MNQLADARRMPRPEISQQLYNLLIRQLDIEYFRFTRKHPIRTTVYNPLAGGLLTGRHTEEASKDDSRFEGNALYQKRYWTRTMFEHVSALAAIAQKEGLSLVELAYAWVVGRDGVDSVLVGPGSVEHLDAAIAACQKRVSPEACQRIDELYTAVQGTNATYAR
jgi:aryl-alcohol dehydrogenase-like predicted oxidoreductase